MANTPRKLPFWLILSLMLNMLLIGLIAGALAKRGGGSPAPDRPIIERHLGDMSAGDRREVRQIMRRTLKAAKPEADVRRSAREALAKALTADPYDAAAVSAATADLREAEAALMAKLHAGLEPELATLSPEQRSAVVRAMGRPQGRRRGERRRRR